LRKSAEKKAFQAINDERCPCERKGHPMTAKCGPIENGNGRASLESRNIIKQFGDFSELTINLKMEV
jgi:hypothetical protein